MTNQEAISELIKLKNSRLFPGQLLAKDSPEYKADAALQKAIDLLSSWDDVEKVIELHKLKPHRRGMSRFTSMVVEIYEQLKQVEEDDEKVIFKFVKEVDND